MRQYLCSGGANSDPSKWAGTIKYISQNNNLIEMEINSRGSYFHILVGKHRYGNFICIPNWDVGTELASLKDRFWNLERLTSLYPKIQPADLVSVVDGLKELSKVLDEHNIDILE